jgi:phage tail-like protein
MLYGEPLYSEGADNTAFFLKRLVESMPPAYRPPETRDFLERFLLPSAEDLNRVNGTIDVLDTYVLPESAPEEWVDWMLTEWLGWSLIPDGYPLHRKRRLLRNLHAHYKRRYTVGRNTAKSYVTIPEQLADPESGEGLKLLLREFGIVAEVFDRPLYVGSYLSEVGVGGPLDCVVRVHYYEPWESPLDTFLGGYLGNIYAYRTTPLITNAFVASLCEWSRPGGVRMVIHFMTRSATLRVPILLYDEETDISITDQVTSEPHIFGSGETPINPNLLQNEEDLFLEIDDDLIIET